MFNQRVCIKSIGQCSTKEDWCIFRTLVFKRGRFVFKLEDSHKSRSFVFNLQDYALNQMVGVNL